jgi:hypothetical protein
MNKFVQFVMNRLGEQSTYNGLTLLCTLVGIAISPEQTHAIAAFGASVVGLISTFFPDSSKKKIAQDLVNVHPHIVAAVVRDATKRVQSSTSRSSQGSGTSGKESTGTPDQFL